MPTDDRARLNDAESAFPIGPRMREPSPESAVQRGQARTFCATAEDQKLVSQSQVFEEQISAGFEPCESNLEQECQPTDHGIKDWLNCGENRVFLPRTEFLPTTGGDARRHRLAIISSICVRMSAARK